jgi:cell division protein FtsI/penicillin-binding protein 2
MNKRQFSFVFIFLLFITFIIIVSISCSNLIKRRYFTGYYLTKSHSKSIQLNNKNKFIYTRTGKITTDSSGLKALIAIAERKSDESSLPKG